MSQTNYQTCTSAFKVRNIESFKRALRLANIYPAPHEDESCISACYIFDEAKGTFVISGHFDGNVGTFDKDTEEQKDRPLVNLIRSHADLTGDIDKITVVTNFAEKRGGLIVNAGAWIDLVYKPKGGNKRLIKQISNNWTMN